MRKISAIFIACIITLAISEITFGQDEVSCPGYSIFSQPNDYKASGSTSDTESFGKNERAFDNFWSVSGDIYGITFWGSFHGAVPTSAVFEIIFWEDNAGTIGAQVESFTVTIEPESVGGGYRFEGFFPSAVTLSDGWVSVQRINPGGSPPFTWYRTQNWIGDNLRGYEIDGTIYMMIYDMSFCLSGVGRPTIPISNWAIFIAVFLIAAASIYRFRGVFI